MYVRIHRQSGEYYKDLDQHLDLKPHSLYCFVTSDHNYSYAINTSSADPFMFKLAYCLGFIHLIFLICYVFFCIFFFFFFFWWGGGGGVVVIIFMFLIFFGKYCFRN